MPVAPDRVACPKCGVNNMPGMQACWRCGAQLPPSVPVQPDPHGYSPGPIPPWLPVNQYMLPPMQPRRGSSVLKACGCIGVLAFLGVIAAVWLFAGRVMPISPERFLTVTQGMTKDQVEATLGKPLLVRQGTASPRMGLDYNVIAAPTEVWVYNGGYVMFQHGLVAESMPGPPPGLMPSSAAEPSNY